MIESRIRARSGTRVVAGLVGTAAQAAMLAACAPPPNADIACAWPIVADETRSNVAYPDAGATYWATRYRLAPGQQLLVRGSFAEARYQSFVTYGTTGTPVDVLTDRDTAAEPGSTNPFVDAAAPPDPAQRRYSVVVDPQVAPGGADNVLAAGASPGSTASGTIILRVYVPDDPTDAQGGVALPSLSVRGADGAVTAIPACGTAAPDPGIIDLLNLFGPPTDQPALDPPSVVRPANTAGLFANPDNTYVASVVSHEPGRVVIVQGGAPTFPDTGAGVSPTEPAQLRYWSMCMNEYRKPYPVTSCATDAETALDAAGQYTYVVSTAQDRPSNATSANDMTWLEWGSTSVDGLLILRNMLPAADFDHAAQNVAPGAAASTAMGSYAPRARYCTTAEVELEGAAACAP